jgi:hypothetical protein
MNIQDVYEMVQSKAVHQMQIKIEDRKQCGCIECQEYLDKILEAFRAEANHDG